MKKIMLLLLPVVLPACREPVKRDPVQENQWQMRLPASQRSILLLYTPDVKQSYMDTAARHIHHTFGLGVKTELLQALPPNLESAHHKGRYRADSILHFLRGHYARQALKVILLTGRDISTTKYHRDGKIKQPEMRYRDWAIFGLGSCPGYCCVVSVKRLWARQAGTKTFLQRMKNIAVHELGHTFGLPHCPAPRCVMNDANETILTVDRSTGTFCEKCRLFIGLPGQ